jgi:hypothetical protein
MKYTDDQLADLTRRFDQILRTDERGLMSWHQVRNTLAKQLYEALEERLGTSVHTINLPLPKGTSVNLGTTSAAELLCDDYIKRYIFAVVWSPEDNEYAGLCTEFPSLSHLDAHREEALNGIITLVEDVVTDMLTSGEKVPEPIGPGESKE